MSGQPEKICPKCSQRAPLDATFCANCGHQFRTRFTPPADQTIMAPPPQAAPAPSYNPAAPASGPLDTTERSVSMAWTFIGAVGVSAVMLYDVHQLTRLILLNLWDFAAYWGIGMLLLGSVFSFLLMRYRRLYLSTPGYTDPYLVAERRRRFSVNASIGIAFLAVAGVSICGLEIAREVAAQAEVRAAAQRRAAEAEQARREEAERRRQEQEEMRRILERQQQQSRYYYQPAAPAPASPSPNLFPGAPTSPSYTRPVPAPRPVRRAPFGGLGSAPPPALSQPDQMPCGHPFSRFVESGGLGGGGGFVALCIQGHRARIQNGRWVAVP